MMQEHQPWPESSGRTANIALREAAHDAVNLLCERVIPICFERLQVKLAEDANELELYELSGMQKGTSADIYVSPESRDTPARDTEPRLTLTLLLGPDPLLASGEEENSGERIRIYLPMYDGYQYPEPIQTEDMPTDLYFEFVPDPNTHEPSQRFVIQRDTEGDPAQRYRLFRYDSAADGREEVIYDSFAVDENLVAVDERIPVDAKRAVWLIEKLARFKEQVQKSVDPYSREP